MTRRARTEPREEKHCAACGRPFAWRKRWARTWSQVRYCSGACRRRRKHPQDAALEAAILDLLASRRPDATICPSDAARRVAPDDWRTLMEPTRRAARRLALQGRVRILQQGRAVDPGRIRGPIRIARGTTTDARPGGGR